MADTIIVWIVQKEKGLLRAIFKSGNEKFDLSGCGRRIYTYEDFSINNFIYFTIFQNQRHTKCA